MSVEQHNEERIFKAAIKIESSAERAAFLQEACGSDGDLLVRLETLLRAHDEAGDFLEIPPFGSGVAPDLSPVAEGPGTVIGRYKLLEKIGEGGMAVVYMAEQTEPIRRKVALKIIKLGMDTRQVIARFEAERQALALMDHPSIAKVLDAGATETGRPYFVMELVTGVSITEYCDKNGLSTKDRLALFLQVCHAVQHAHQKGIIHRDIKPSNVMVTHHDGKPVPKMIDFGIAKATSQKLTEKTLFTRYAHIIGTPAYMSPEQAELSDLDIDTRSDIYSLGVLLYELLTGTTPFSEEELRQAGYLEMQRVIREQEPVKPSTRIRAATRERRSPERPLGEGQSGDWRSQGTRFQTGGPAYQQVRGDLDWIVMKSLEKDRARRYETASGLAEDIRRHLESEPVLARCPSTMYRLGKFVRKHRSQVLAALATVVVVCAGVVLLFLWNRDRRQLAQAEGLRHQAILSQAREQYAKADREAALETIKPILQSKHVGPEAQLLRAGIFVDSRQSDEALKVLGSLLNDRREIAGAAHSLLARILGEGESLNAETLRQIEEHRRQAAALLPETAEAYFLQATAALTVKEQLAALDKALRLDPEHYESLRLRAFTYYASRKYERMADDTLGMTYLRRADPLGYSLRAAALRELNRYRDAIAEYDRASALTPKDSPPYLDLVSQRSETFLRMGDYPRVIAEAQAYTSRTGAKTPSSLQYHVFCAQTALGDFDAATTLFRQIVRTGPESRGQLEDWCGRYVFDTLEAGRPWHPANHQPTGVAFLPMVEAEETYHRLSAKARRVIADGFTTRWSTDGKKLAFSMGFVGYNGVALYDLATRETELLIVPGKDPTWSPDGRYIAFVRDCQALRVPEFATAERRERERPRAEEEVWLMKPDGTEPRRLARGGWPSWSQDSKSVYYQSRLDNAVYSISIEGRDADPEWITACPDPWPAMSLDGQRVAYREAGLLKVKDLASQAIVAQWPMPPLTWGGPAWSPSGTELCMGTITGVGNKMGLWVYRLDRSEPLRTLDGQITAAFWAPDGTKLVFHRGAPFFEVWTADIDPNVSLAEALGSAQTRDEYFQESVALWTRRIEADPTDANNYRHRAGCYQSLREEAKARADTRRCWAALHPGWPPGFCRGGPWSIMHTVDGPSDYQLVLFLESQEDGIYTIRVAFGRKGRCEMKLFEIPMVVTSLLGLCFLSGLDTRTAQAAFTFGKAENLGRPLNSAEREDWPVLSPDGLELYFMSERPGGYGRWDIWRSQRAGLEDSWGPPVNLGPGINDGGDNVATSISSDGLTFYLFATTGTFADLYTATRPTKDAPWGPRVNMGPVLNRPDEGDWVTMWGNDATPVISPDGLELFFSSWRPDAIGAADIYVSKRATLADPWGPPENLGPTINTPDDDGPAAISPDGLVLFIGSENRPGGFGNWDTWMIRRPYKGAPWSKPVNLGPSFNTPYGEILTGLSPDGQWAYFSDFCWSGEARRPGGYGEGDLWMAPIIPTVDFNADGKIDVVDLVMLINDWGTNKTLCDIGPMPWGDGKVDTADLKVFMTYFEKENSPAQGAGTMFPDFIATEGSAEGVAVDETGNVYVTVRAASDQVWKFSPSGEKSILADLGAPGGGAVGLALDAAGNVYACRALTGSGVYRIAPDGQTVRLPGTEQIVFPNALVFDDQETLYITETVSGDVAAKSFAPGGIWRLKKGGAAELWLRHELLTGLAPTFFPYPVGANGIVLYQGNLYVANTDKAHIVRIPVRPDGSAGQPEVWKKVEDVPESSLYNAPAFPLMLDGLALDAQGNIYVAVPSRNAIVRIEAHDRSQKTVAVHPQVPLDAPVSLAFGTDKSGSESLFITNLGMCAALIPNQTWPGPGLVKTNVPGPEGSN